MNREQIFAKAVLLTQDVVFCKAISSEIKISNLQDNGLSDNEIIRFLATGLLYEAHNYIGNPNKFNESEIR